MRGVKIEGGQEMICPRLTNRVK